MTTFSWIRFNCLNATEPLRGDSLISATKFLGVLCTRLIDLGRMNSRVNLIPLTELFLLLSYTSLTRKFIAFGYIAKHFAIAFLTFLFLIPSAVFGRTGKCFLKDVSATFLLVCFICLNENTCETRKNIFYFISKALFVLEIIKF